ncbi:MAG: hypothetical protein HOM14_00150 [Gammaproteobacteria bacterium]|jgi:hypothetical protein|nr:hypothetical protein [Gammaproteobacteria bacterium]MBT3724824.1 hypothetical protein [Gammaproteobacteria bacterium]MBT4194873.1 hypothetical protein [Gammaproteobacteria bacterium]MBT4448072.1 hypothetical protein [Gammaproteobacteria bacterium]MBT4860096.1 hypothetical protein [Gammaproteobacteria bacterium]
MQQDSPLRLLVKSYSNGLIDRHQYLEIRTQLLKKLSAQGEVTQEDLKNFLNINQDMVKESFWGGYSISDWIIIILGLMAAATLALFLYN